jgi:hypothetical protein
MHFLFTILHFSNTQQQQKSHDIISNLIRNLRNGLRCMETLKIATSMSYPVWAGSCFFKRKNQWVSVGYIDPLTSGSQKVKEPVLTQRPKEPITECTLKSPVLCQFFIKTSRFVENFQISETQDWIQTFF